jgi:hypothetical protein
VGCAVGGAVGAAAGGVVGPAGVVGSPGVVEGVALGAAGPPVGPPGISGNVGAGEAPVSFPGEVDNVGLALAAVGSATIEPGDAETGATTTSSCGPGPDGGGTIADSVLASTSAMSSPKPIPTAVWR